ncbi:prepilin-type N-terminal cleavage/methylation domain-containing protein [Idiomarina abyssalis]|uniref:Prepilin-type N-terminal cleavage/methylation domain-containing protein n=1 Tax=Idiomarina abyssalis TaxID=86102 RepID=A0A8I1GAN7_9GAMM|nr:prepilin-type N-terminal cleavage/methylation domain-containing protein [Idiomarina abyssalis]MBJ7265591.1 prepilin-type N-terminal cleavage/methylation domain-containing protein [Idiomarina abyssalis]MBJ7316735.1 prepilin-type N-terminal cleavage/methylation domain-containing protein [Idiomarina abyssalis]
MSTNRKPFLVATEKQKGFTIVELMIVVAVLGIMAMALAASTTDLFSSNKVNQAVEQTGKITAAVNNWSGRGLYTGVSLAELIDGGYYTPPKDNNGNFLSASEINPWSGPVMVSSPSPTSYTIQFSGIATPEAAIQLQDKLQHAGTITNSSPDSVTVLMGQN